MLSLTNKILFTFFLIENPGSLGPENASPNNGGLRGRY